MNNSIVLFFINIVSGDLFLQYTWIIQIVLLLIFCIAIFFRKNKKKFKLIFLFFSVLAILALLIELTAVLEIISSSTILPVEALPRKALLEICGFCHLLFLPLWLIKRKF